MHATRRAGRDFLVWVPMALRALIPPPPASRVACNLLKSELFPFISFYDCFLLLAAPILPQEFGYAQGTERADFASRQRH